MSLKCGIVGLPNVGKSTLFNALTKAGIAAAARQTTGLAAGGATLEDLARDYAMTLGTTDYVTGATDNDEIARDRAFATAADAAHAVTLRNAGVVGYIPAGSTAAVISPFCRSVYDMMEYVLVLLDSAAGVVICRR